MEQIEPAVWLPWVVPGLVAGIAALVGSWFGTRLRRGETLDDREWQALTQARDAWADASVDKLEKARWVVAEQLRNAAGQIRNRSRRTGLYAAADYLETYTSVERSAGTALWRSRSVANSLIQSGLRSGRLSWQQRRALRRLLTDAKEARQIYDDEHDFDD